MGNDGEFCSCWWGRCGSRFCCRITRAQRRRYHFWPRSDRRYCWWRNGDGGVFGDCCSCGYRNIVWVGTLSTTHPAIAAHHRADYPSLDCVTTKIVGTIEICRGSALLLASWRADSMNIVCLPYSLFPSPTRSAAAIPRRIRYSHVPAMVRSPRWVFTVLTRAYVAGSSRTQTLIRRPSGAS